MGIIKVFFHSGAHVSYVLLTVSVILHINNDLRALGIRNNCLLELNGVANFI